MAPGERSSRAFEKWSDAARRIFAGAPWSRQDDYDLRYLLEYEGRSEPEIARFLQREPREIDDRIKASTRDGGWRPLSTSDSNVVNLIDRAGRKRWHK